MTVVDGGTVEDLLSRQRRRPVLFVSVGSDHHRFDRLVGWVDRWVADRDVDCVIQYGTATPPRSAHGVDYLDKDVLGMALRQSDVLIAQGGPMSIVEARRAGRVPIVVPRVPELREVVDDHQVTFCRKLAEVGDILLAEDEVTLRAHLDRVVSDTEVLRIPGRAGPESETVAEAVTRIRRVADGLVAPRLAPPPRVLLLGGMGRSGSTLLERILGQAASVVEIGEAVHLWERGLHDDELCGCGQPFSRCSFWSRVGDAAYDGWTAVDTEDAVRLRRTVVRNRFAPGLLFAAPRTGWRLDRDRLVRMVEDLYRGVTAVSGAEVIADSSKHPAYAMLLRRACLDLRCVLVVRDPRGVANSWRRSVRRPEITDRVEEMPRYGLVYTSVIWQVYALLYAALRRLGVPVMTVRYEDVLEEPEATVAAILEFAGASDTAPVPGLTPDRVVLEPGHTVAGNPMRFTHGEVPLRRDDRWREEMNPRERRLVSRLTWVARRRYGYR